MTGFLLLCFTTMIKNADSQEYKDLKKLTGYRVNAWCSPAAEAKAKKMAARLDSVTAFYQEHLRFTPIVTLLVLSPGDWRAHTDFPVYGMPHYNDQQTLVLASEDNDFWRSLLPATDKLPAAYAEQVAQVYRGSNGTISMEAFFDLLAIHELGHAYYQQAGLLMQRHWLSELLPNILLHAYIAEKEPALLPALTLFPKIVVTTTDKSSLKYTSLADLETYYNDLGKNYPQNYGWYQCRWHVAAGDIYEKGGVNGLARLWNALKTQKETLSDSALVHLLTINALPVANMYNSWE